MSEYEANLKLSKRLSKSLFAGGGTPPASLLVGLMSDAYKVKRCGRCKRGPRSYLLDRWRARSFRASIPWARGNQLKASGDLYKICHIAAASIYLRPRPKSRDMTSEWVFRLPLLLLFWVHSRMETEFRLLEVWRFGICGHVWP